MSKKTKFDLAAMLSVPAGELATVNGGVVSSFSGGNMSIAAGTELSFGTGDPTDPKNEHTDDDDSSVIAGGLWALGGAGGKSAL